MCYLLLNKDIVWLSFRCERNEYLEVTAQEEVWYTEKRPFGYTNLTDFLERRKAPKHRAHIAELLKQYGCQELDGYLDVTHALSLNDTFWVKRVDSPLKWREVSLYRNPFNEVISEAALMVLRAAPPFPPPRRSSAQMVSMPSVGYGRTTPFGSTRPAASLAWSHFQNIWLLSWQPVSVRMP